LDVWLLKLRADADESLDVETLSDGKFGSYGTNQDSLPGIEKAFFSL